ARRGRGNRRLDVAHGRRGDGGTAPGRRCRGRPGAGHRGPGRERSFHPRAQSAGRAAAPAARALWPRAHADDLSARAAAAFPCPVHRGTFRGCRAGHCGPVPGCDRLPAERRAVRMSTATGPRSRKDLRCTAAATAHQKAFIGDLRRRVFENGEPFVVAQADTPHEIFHAMDIPVVTNQWWSAYIAAKQMSARYFDAMSRAGFPENTCRYCSLGLACTLANDPATAPWGGLPKPALLVARLT